MNQLATNFLARLHPLDRGERKDYRSRMIPHLGIGFEADVNVGMMRKPSRRIISLAFAPLGCVMFHHVPALPGDRL